MNGTEQRNARMSKDNVNSPSHYTQAGIECIDAITAAVSGKSGIEAVCVANVIKYLWRYELKNGVEDVKKAQWYLNRLVSELGGKQGPKKDACDHIYGLYLNGESRCVKCGVMQ
jgi:hypothetical protein